MGVSLAQSLLLALSLEGTVLLGAPMWAPVHLMHCIHFPYAKWWATRGVRQSARQVNFSSGYTSLKILTVSLAKLARSAAPGFIFFRTIHA